MVFFLYFYFNDYFSFWIKVPWNIFNNIVYISKGFAIIFANFNIKFFFKHNVNFSHIKSIEADFVKWTSNLDFTCMNRQIVMKSNTSNNPFSSNNRIGHVTIAIISRHKDVVFIVVSDWLNTSKLWFISSVNNSWCNNCSSSYRLSNDFTKHLF